MSSPVIAWLSDFGTRDHYAGTMKGVALSIAPDVTCIDITHEIEPQDVVGGAMELAAACRFFPAGTVFVAVVDPGVGSARRAIAVSAGGYSFVAPDNGLLTLALRGLDNRVVVELLNDHFALPLVSNTFEGRDRFAPAAAWLSRGPALEELGPVRSGITELTLPEPQQTSEQLIGEVLRIDRFGNAVTNIARPVLDAWCRGGSFRIVAGSTRLDRMVEHYAQVPPGAPCALFGSTERLELAVGNGSAALALGISRGAVVRLSRA